MATDFTMPSMFDTRYAMDRQMEIDAQTAGQSGLGGRYGMYYNSSLLGDRDNASLMSLAGMFGGGGDPRMQKQMAIDSIMQQYPNPETADDFVAISGALRQSGLYEEADRAMSMANDIIQSMPQRTKTQAADGYYYYDDTGERVFPNVTKAPEKPSTLMEKIELWNSLTEQERKEYTEAGIFGKNATNINLGGQDKYSEEVGKIRAERDFAIIDNAELAIEGFEKTNDALEILAGGNAEVITGFGADAFLQVEKIAKALGVREGKRIKNTEYLEALLGSDVFPMIKSLGIGARGLDTPEERKFLQGVMTGTKTMDAESIEQLTRLRQKYYKRAIEKYNERLRSGKFELYEKSLSTDDFEYKLEELPIPESYVKPVQVIHPEGTVEGVANDGTPVYKYPDGTYHLADGTEVEIE